MQSHKVTSQNGFTPSLGTVKEFMLLSLLIVHLQLLHVERDAPPQLKTVSKNVLMKKLQVVILRTPSNSTYNLVGGVPWRRSSTPAKILNGINLAKEMFLPIRIHNLDLLGVVSSQVRRSWQYLVGVVRLRNCWSSARAQQTGPILKEESPECDSSLPYIVYQQNKLTRSMTSNENIIRGASELTVHSIRQALGFTRC